MIDHIPNKGEVYYHVDDEHEAEVVGSLTYQYGFGESQTYIGFSYGEDNMETSLFLEQFNRYYRKRVKNTRLARKIYPNADISKDGEWIYV